MSSTDSASTRLAGIAGDCFYQPVHARNVGLVRKLLDVALPVAYGDDFYAKLQETPQEFTKMGAFWGLWGVVAARASVFPLRRVSLTRPAPAACQPSPQSTTRTFSWA